MHQLKSINLDQSRGSHRTGVRFWSINHIWGVLCVPCRHVFDMQKNGVHQHLVVRWPEWCEPTNPGISASPETGGQWDPDPCSSQGVDSLEDQIFRSIPHLRATQWPFSKHRPWSMVHNQSYSRGLKTHGNSKFSLIVSLFKKTRENPPAHPNNKNM